MTTILRRARTQTGGVAWILAAMTVAGAAITLDGCKTNNLSATTNSVTESVAADAPTTIKGPNGSEVAFPAMAFAVDTEVTIAVADGSSPTLSGLTGSVYSITSAGAQTLALPMTVSLPGLGGTVSYLHAGAWTGLASTPAGSLVAAQSTEFGDFGVASGSTGPGHSGGDGGAMGGSCGTIAIPDGGAAAKAAVTANIAGIAANAVDGYATVSTMMSGLGTQTMYNTSLTLAFTAYANACGYSEARLLPRSSSLFVVSVSASSTGAPPDLTQSSTSSTPPSVTLYVTSAATSNCSSSAFDTCQSAVTLTTVDADHVVGSISCTGQQSGSNTVMGSFDLPICNNAETVNIAAACCQ